MGAAIGNLNKESEQTDESSVNQTNQPDGSSLNQVNQTNASSNQANQTNGSSVNQANQTNGSSVNQANQTNASSLNQTNQTNATSLNQTNQSKGSSLANKMVTVVFVLGGPGSGKGTQCANIVKQYGYTHLSAGDLLRAEMNSGSENGTMIQNMIKEGKIVPAEVTIKLLQKAMMDSTNDKFLIDGFPRNEENRAAFESVTGIEPAFVLFFDCPEKEMEKRLLGRNQGREDDNIETIRKRFKVYLESSLPVIDYYNAKGKVRKIDAAKPADEVFVAVQAAFA